jgi:hypothetical protein
VDVGLGAQEIAESTTTAEDNSKISLCALRRFLLDWGIEPKENVSFSFFKLFLFFVSIQDISWPFCQI